VRLDDERCIMCSRCIRFTAEIADDPVLGFTERGSHTTLAVHPGKRLEHNYSLNTVDICPVGAFTSNDFRFQQRVWFLTETNSICTGCGRGCNMEIGARGDTIYRQTPRDNNDVNSTWMCDSGRLDFHFVNSEFRLTDPMVKTGGKHKIATWKTALNNIATALAGKKGEEIAIIASARMTNEELFFVKHLAAQLGTTNVDVIPRTGGSITTSAPTTSIRTPTARNSSSASNPAQTGRNHRKRCPVASFAAFWPSARICSKSASRSATSKKCPSSPLCTFWPTPAPN
jgi:NADH-quinone oxidoreductase subunit G